jgi:hypothetical protein
MNDAARRSEAVDALGEIARRQREVVTKALVPAWYWRAVAMASVVLGAAVDSLAPVAIAVVAIVYGLGVAVLTAWVVFGGLARVKPHEGLLGPSGAVMIIGFVAIMVGASLGIGFVALGAGFGWPATLATLVCAAILVIGGPRLMRRLGATMLRHRVGAIE